VGNHQKGNAYKKFGVVTIASVYLLIFVGGLVRMTGSGMGCPDWPKCFGQWIPPTEVSELPPNYKEVYQVQGKEIADFNAFHTWVEYVNRLIGALIGLFIFITFLLSLSFWKQDKAVTLLSFLVVLAVGFQGWLGAQVVASNLATYMITLHMLMALAIVGVLIYTVSRAYKVDFGQSPANLGKLNLWLVAGIVLSLIQIVMGTQVRENVDEVAKAFDGTQRELWVGQLDLIFYVHRSFSLLVLGVHAWFAWLLMKSSRERFNPANNKWALALLTILVLETLSGAAMAYFGIPKLLQPLHLLLGTMVFGVQIVLLVRLNSSRPSNTTQSPSVAEKVSLG